MSRLDGVEVLVTGGSGFVGANLVRALVGEGARVRCLVRPGRPSPPANLRGVPVQLVEGDVVDRRALARAVRGAKLVFHCAAVYRLWTPSPAEMYRTNVDGTRAVLEVAGAAGVDRVVHTSSVGALGLEPDGRPATEETPAREADMVGHYKRSKFRAERIAEELARRGVPIVIVNPSTPIGALDRKPTPTGKMIVDVVNRRAPAYTDTGLNIVDVRDVARGFLLAAARGRAGEKYILGGCNLPLREVFALIARAGGLRPPRLRLPHWLVAAVARVDTSMAQLTGRPPAVPVDAVRMARKRMFFDSGKAEAELGYRAGRIEPAFDRAVRWFRDHGYIQR